METWSPLPLRGLVGGVELEIFVSLEEIFLKILNYLPENLNKVSHFH